MFSPMSQNRLLAKVSSHIPTFYTTRVELQAKSQGHASTSSCVRASKDQDQ